MRKDLDGLVDPLFDTLMKSVSAIAISAADNREDLVARSIGEFKVALMTKLEPVVLSYPEEELAKGLNHIAMYASALRDFGRTVEAIKTGRPSWMVSDSTSMPEVVPPDIADMMDHTVHVGVLALQSMVNDTAIEIEDPDDLERAEQSGELHKIDCLDGHPILVKTMLPDDYRQLLTDPVDLMSEFALAGRTLLNKAIDIAEPLIEIGVLPAYCFTEFPELFKAEDEELGTGGDPDGANDPGDPGADPNDPNAGGATDDGPQDPIDMITRLASIIVVVAGSLKQAGQADDTTDPNNVTGNDTTAGMPDDTTAANPLQRRAPSVSIGEVPLEKITRGEIAVHSSLADALEELYALRKDAPRHVATQQELAMLKATVARLQAQPAPPKGPLFQISKSNDAFGGEAPATQVVATSERIEELAKINPEAAARELLKVVHAGGGVPLVPAH